MSISLKQIPFILRPLSRLGLREKPFPINRYGKKNLETKKYYLDLHKSLISKKSELADKIEKDLNMKINRNWFNNLALYTQTTRKSSPYEIIHGRILYSLLKFTF